MSVVIALLVMNLAGPCSFYELNGGQHYGRLRALCQVHET